MNLHDWIDELCDALDLDAEVDEGLVLDLARVAAHNVLRPAAPAAEDEDVDVPDDSGVDHTGDAREFEDA